MIKIKVNKIANLKKSLNINIMPNYIIFHTLFDTNYLPIFENTRSSTHFCLTVAFQTHYVKKILLYLLIIKVYTSS